MSESRVWRIEFDNDAARDLRKLGAEPQRLILRYLRGTHRCWSKTHAASADP